MFFTTGCKKSIFKPLTFSGKVTSQNYSTPLANYTVVLYKNRGSVLRKIGILDSQKEICRATTSSDGTFSMKLKWLDNRDTYDVKIYFNNTISNITSNNSRFSSYKALESNVEFKVY
jgi:hypothetical protein